MTNFKNTDRRIDRTRKSLQVALIALILEKGYEKVTVQNVIDRANVGRSTFYAHFVDLDDLLISQFDGLQEQFGQHLDSQPASAADPWEVTWLIFQHAQGQRQLYKALIENRGGNILMTHINKYFSEIIQDHVTLHLSRRNDEIVPPEILVHYIASSFMSLLTWWLGHDLPYSAGCMNNMFRELMEHGVESMLEQTGSVAVQFEMLSNKQ
jgi:AcrR family transcriptional regulator